MSERARAELAELQAQVEAERQARPGPVDDVLARVARLAGDLEAAGFRAAWTVERALEGGPVTVRVKVEVPTD